MSPRMYAIAAAVFALIAVVSEYDGLLGLSLVLVAAAAFWVHDGVATTPDPERAGESRLAGERRWGRDSAGVLIVVVGAAVLGAVAPGVSYEPAVFLLVLAAIRLAESDVASQWVRVGGGVFAIAIPPLIQLATQLRPGDGWAWYIWTVGIAVGWFFGDRLRSQRQLAAAVAETQRASADRAILDERRRIARDLHDEVGHMLAAMMLHVSGARHVLDRDPKEAERALVQAEDVGRESLRQIRETVGMLRTDGDSALAPVVTVEDVPVLIDTYRNAGLEIASDLEGLAGISGALGVAVYRIVQESLANVVRHASGAQVRVRAERGDPLILTIANTVDGTQPEPGAGHGLAGMTERAAALGGTLIAGDGEGGWTVQARLPRPEPAVVDHTISGTESA